MYGLSARRVATLNGGPGFDHVDVYVDVCRGESIRDYDLYFVYRCPVRAYQIRDQTVAPGIFRCGIFCDAVFGRRGRGGTFGCCVGCLFVVWESRFVFFLKHGGIIVLRTRCAPQTLSTRTTQPSRSFSLLSNDSNKHIYIYCKSCSFMV